MKQRICTILIIACLSLLTSCKDSSKKEANSSTITSENNHGDDNSGSKEITGKKDERI